MRPPANHGYVRPVDKGQRIWEELRQSEWVDGNLDYETVMAELAGPHGAFAISRAHRLVAVGAVFWSERDAQLLNELTAIARAPYLAMPWPEAPSVELERLAADFHRTTGRLTTLKLRWENYPGGGYWVCDVAIDGSPRGTTGVNGSTGTPEETLAAIADRLCEGWLHEEVWGGWPICPRHRTHPLDARVDQSVATWCCPREGVIARIGDLAP